MPGLTRGRGPTSRPAAAGRAPAERRRGWRLVRADTDAVPGSVRRFMRRARRRRLRAALPWASVVAVLAIGALLAWLLTGTSLFGVRQVRVTGAELVTPAQVRAAASVADGTPLARVDVAAVAARVGKLPPVRRAEVSRRWPGTLSIELVERTAVAAVTQGDRYLVVDDEAVVFRELDRPPAGLALVRVGRLGPDDPAIRDALRVLRVLTPALRESLVELVVDGSAGIRLSLRGERVVIWGDATEGDTKARVATALLSRPGDTIDVSAPDVVTIR